MITRIVMQLYNLLPKLLQFQVHTEGESETRYDNVYRQVLGCKE
jgi:hypothetical protein